MAQSEWDNHKRFNVFSKVSEHVLRQTSTPAAPWVVVEGSEPRYRDITVAVLRTPLAAAQRQPRAKPSVAVTRRPPKLIHSTDKRDLLHALDLTRTISEKRYEKDLERLQAELALHSRHPEFRKMSMVLVFEGADAAGKGGTIRRITGALDARVYRADPHRSPLRRRARPALPLALLEEHPATRELHPLRLELVRARARRAGRGVLYPGGVAARLLGDHDFEEQLVKDRIVVLKFWLHISRASSCAASSSGRRWRFKRYKITEEDWRNRRKWAASTRRRSTRRSTAPRPTSRPGS